MNSDLGVTVVGGRFENSIDKNLGLNRSVDWEKNRVELVVIKYG